MSEAHFHTQHMTAPFEAADVKWKPQTVKDNRALAMAYIDARVVMDRLDETVGPHNWKDDYTIDTSGSVVCRLSVRFDGEWIMKTDVGSLSEQPDGGDRLKAAFSDALKRAAVKFGIGRYLYRLKAQWVDYDGHKKQFTKRPELPFWALPDNEKPAGKGLVKRMTLLAEQVALQSGREDWSTGTVVDGLTERYGHANSVWIENYPRRDVLDMIQRLSGHLEKLVKESPKGERKPEAKPEAKPAGKGQSK